MHLTQILPLFAHSKHAFSLVELSIVLVILGLLTGGILTGQSLIRAAEIRSVSIDLQRYQSALYTFRDKYMALPGDMTNATRFWGIRAGTGSDLTCHQTINTYSGTCNGNGNGMIAPIAGDSTHGERFAAWQHLANAGLIEGSYTGASTSTTAEGRSNGVNLPNSKLSNTGYLLLYVPANLSGDANFFSGSYDATGIYTSSTSPIMKPEEMWNLDTKMDDGKPATGIIFTFKSTSPWQPGCATTDNTATAEYAVTDPAPRCKPNLLFR